MALTVQLGSTTNQRDKFGAAPGLEDAPHFRRQQALHGNQGLGHRRAPFFCATGSFRAADTPVKNLRDHRAASPEGADFVDGGTRFFEGGRAGTSGAALDGRRDQTGVLQDADVLGNGRQGHLEAVRQLGHLFAARERRDEEISRAGCSRAREHAIESPAFLSTMWLTLSGRGPMSGTTLVDSQRSAAARWPIMRPGRALPISRTANTTPGTNEERSMASCRMVRVSPCVPKSTSCRATRPARRTECTRTPETFAPRAPAGAEVVASAGATPARDRAAASVRPCGRRSPTARRPWWDDATRSPQRIRRSAQHTRRSASRARHQWRSWARSARQPSAGPSQLPTRFRRTVSRICRGTTVAHDSRIGRTLWAPVRAPAVQPIQDESSRPRKPPARATRGEATSRPTWPPGRGPATATPADDPNHTIDPPRPTE